jgi:hypothetical protein
MSSNSFIFIFHVSPAFGRLLDSCRLTLPDLRECNGISVGNAWTCAGGDSEIVTMGAIEKSLENELPNLLRDARHRVIIELSPGEPETTPNTTPGASHVENGEPIMCYADTVTNDDGTATAFCYCGWSADHATPEAADTDAERHQTAADAAESLFAA